MADKWPTPEQYDEISAESFERIRELVNEGRWVIAELPGNAKQTLLFGNDSLVEQNQAMIKHLLRLKDIRQTDQPSGLRLAANNREVWLDIDSETLYQHQSNLEVRLAEARVRQANLSGRLSNESYVQKAPEKLVEETRRELVEQNELIERLVAELEVISLD